MPRFVKIGNIHVGATRQNPCFQYIEYMERRHPGEINARDMRITYTDADSDVQTECLAQLRDRIRADK